MGDGMRRRRGIIQFSCFLISFSGAALAVDGLVASASPPSKADCELLCQRAFNEKLSTGDKAKLAICQTDNICRAQIGDGPSFGASIKGPFKIDAPKFGE